MHFYLKNIQALIYLSTIFLFVSGCHSAVDDDTGNSKLNENDNDKSDWLIPEDQVFTGTGRDAIPSNDNWFAGVDFFGFDPNEPKIIIT